MAIITALGGRHNAGGQGGVPISQREACTGHTAAARAQHLKLHPGGPAHPTLSVQLQMGGGDPHPLLVEGGKGGGLRMGPGQASSSSLHSSCPPLPTAPVSKQAGKSRVTPDVLSPRPSNTGPQSPGGPPWPWGQQTKGMASDVDGQHGGLFSSRSPVLAPPPQ